MKWIVLALVVATTAASQVCPKDISKEIGKCMTPIQDFENNKGGAGSMFMFMSALDMTQELCRQEKLQQVFACLHRVYNQCARTREGAEAMGLVMDPNRWQEAISLICLHNDYLRINVRCESRARPEFQMCVAEEINALKEKLQTLRQQMADPTIYTTEKQKMRAKTELGCLVTLKIQDCLRIPYKHHCPEKMQKILMEVIQNFMPPACSKHEPAYPSPDMVQTGPSYHHPGSAGKPSALGRDDSISHNHKNNDNNNNNKNEDFVRDVIIGTHRDTEGIEGDASEDGQYPGGSSQEEEEEGAIALGNPGEAAESVRSDKDGALGVHGGTGQQLTGLLLPVLMWLLTTAAMRAAA